ncbi:MAG TPA: XrtA system polysaccharide chain length determinant [Steroidobacteraceae bacterium]|nr:XrtA system polysaccharide chain length determinant [Steroidobacteraceae bacterium]
MSSGIDSQLQFVKDEIRGAWRFRRTAVIVAWAVAVPLWLLICVLPDVFQARARIYVETSTELRPLLQGLAIDSDVQSQLDLVRQALLSRPTLQKIANEAKLHKKNESPLDSEELIEKLGKKIDLSVEATRGTGNYLYTIAYDDHDRERSVAIVKMLLDTFVEEVIGKKRAGQETAQAFLQEQIRDYERRLSEAENRLADFKRRNMGLVPGESGDYFSRLQTATDALEKDRAALRVAEMRRSELLTQLRGETPYAPVTDSPVSGSASRGGALAGSDTASRLQEAEAKLQDLLLRFTDKHPEVIAMRETIEELKQRQVKELEALKSGNLADAGGQKAFLNPVYQRIQVSLNDLEVEIAALRGQISDHERRSAELRKLADTAPAVEAEFARLNRDYGVTRAQYQSMVERLERARLSDKADETGAVKFTVIDPPVAKIEPVAPKRSLLIIGALVLALAAGAGTAYVLHLMRPVFQTARSLAEFTGLRVLGAISIARPDSWRALQTVAVRRFAVAVSLLPVACLFVLLTDNYVVAMLRRLKSGA